MKNIMKIPTPKFSFGQRVTIKWAEAECADTQGIITCVGMSRTTHSVVYEVVELDDDGDAINGYVDDLSEDMLDLRETCTMCGGHGGVYSGEVDVRGEPVGEQCPECCPEPDMDV